MISIFRNNYRVDELFKIIQAVTISRPKFTEMLNWTDIDLNEKYPRELGF